MSPPTEEIFIKKLLRLQYSLELSKLHWKYRCKAHHSALPAEIRHQYFNYNQCHCIVLRALLKAILKFVTVDVGAHGKQTMVEFSETRLCVGAWKHEVCSCLKIKF